MEGKPVNRLVTRLKNCCLGHLQRKSGHVRFTGQEFAYVCVWKTSKVISIVLRKHPFIVEKFVYTDAMYLQLAFLKQMTV